MVANRYIQLEKIGEGGMGTIFRVQDRLSGEILALKRLDIPHHHLSGRDSHAFRLALAQEFRTPAQALHPRHPRGNMLWARKNSAADPQLVLEVARIYGLIGEISYFTTETLLGVYCVLRMLNLAEQAPPSPELARANVNVSIAAGFIPHHGLAERYGQRAETIAQDIVDPLVLMQVLNIRGVYFTGTGQWARVDDSLDRALALAEQLGDRREAITTQTTRAIAYHYQGRFDEAIALNQHAQEAATQTGNVQQIGWGMYSRAENMNNIRQPQQALAILDELTHDHKHDMQRSALIRIATAYARAHTQLGDWDAALRYDQQARELLGKTSPNVYSMLESYATFADVYLTLCHTHNTPHNRRAAEQGIGILKRYAAIYPVGQARYRLWQGRLDALKGDHQSARARYRQARDIAQKFAMDYDAQLAQHYLDASS